MIRLDATRWGGLQESNHPRRDNAHLSEEALTIKVRETTGFKLLGHQRLSKSTYAYMRMTRHSGISER